jgi:hypothetical protein
LRRPHEKIHAFDSLAVRSTWSLDRE